jgi:hypothetical protein
MPGSIRSRRLVAACAAVGVVWAIVAFLVLSPDVPCTDCSIKYVQAQSLIRSGFRSMALAYPGASIDPDYNLFPIRPPFTLRLAPGPSGLQSIWSPVVVLSQAPFLMLGGLSGLVVLALACGLLVLWLSARLTTPDGHWSLPLVLGLGTCLWYYAVQPWEHTPALAAAVSAIWFAAGKRRWSALAAGMLLGVAGVLREESLLLLPAVWLMLWRRPRRVGALLSACAGVGVVLVAANLVDVLAYARPPAAHALHAVGVLRSALAKTGWVQEVPTTVPRMGIMERYDTVVHYWLVSSVSHATLLTFAAGLGVAGGLARWGRSWTALLAVALVTLAWSFWNVWPLLAGPRPVVGLLTQSPFLLFAFFPVPQLPSDLRRERWLLVAGCAVFVALALVTTDTSGGKSLGPRFLLTIVPLLAVTAWQAVAEYLRAGRQRLVWRLIGWTGVALIVVAVAMNACALRAYAGRAQDDLEAVEAVRRSPARVVVFDNAFTAQIFMPVYFTKVLLLADSGWRARALVESLGGAGVRQVLLVSRDAAPAVSLDPWHVVTLQQTGRMTLVRWAR